MGYKIRHISHWSDVFYSDIVDLPSDLINQLSKQVKLLKKICEWRLH